MYTNRRAILSLVAWGRITPVEAERLIAACSSDREAWWLLAGCALSAGVMQLNPHGAAWLTHLFDGLRAAIASWIPAIQHVVAQATTYLGGNL